MSNQSWTTEFTEPAKDRALMIWNIVLDLAYLLPWYGAQRLLSWIIGSQKTDISITLSSLDELQIISIQIIFAVGTVIPILLYTLKDLIILSIRLWKKVQNERSNRSA